MTAQGVAALVDPVHAGVIALIEHVADHVVMPRFGNLAAHEVHEKAADDLVTIADRESERALDEGLSRLLPHAAVVGEEACAADPAVRDRIDHGLCWIIDPIDGTANFAAGRPPFGIMVALCDGGDTIAGWIYDPVTRRLCHAVRGGGAFINGVRVHARATGAQPPVAAISTLFMSDAQRAQLLPRITGCWSMVDIPRCAAEQYPRLVLGINDISLFERTLPWDHAAGVLFVEEAGGRARRLDGSPYRPCDRGTGLLAAATPDLWDAAKGSGF